MRFVIAVAVAVLLAAVVTEIHFRLFPNAYFALLVLTSAAIVFGTFVTMRAADALAKLGAGATAAIAADDHGRQPRRAANAPSRDAEGSTRPAGGGARETGRVKWFNRTKGFGFIVRDDGGEIFIHHRNINGSGRQSLRDGQRVSYVVVQGDKGLQAEQVESAEAG
jgi:CspA family cold shock protein